MLNITKEALPIMDLKRYKTPVALLSVASNTILVLLKLVVGITIGSVSVISEAIHSGVDLVAALIALFSVRKSAKPADRDHPFGHGKVENVSGTIEAFLILFAAGWIIAEAVHKLRFPREITSAGLGVGVMFLSAALNMVVSHLLFVVGRATDSVALEADAWHLRTDVYTSIGVLLGLFSIWLGRRLMPGVDLAWIDPVAAIVVALLIIRAAYGMVIRSARDILDHSLPDEEVSQLKKIIARRTPSVFGFHDLKTRKGGSTRFVEFHLLVDPKMSVDDSHRVTQILDEDIGRVFSEVEVTIHIEPCDRSCLPKCSENCLISDRSLRPKKT